jgi:glycosyltransferase involved in cell wall biosynthesis
LESQPLVSLVTPFYNTRDYLRECIDSVLRQTYGNWEYLLVDNCSTDGSSEIAQDHARRYPGKIRLIRTESFLSQVQNYNFALSCISPLSKHCKMVQADDWIFPDCVRSMVEVAESHPRVGIVAAYELEGEDVRLDGLPYPSPEISGRDACRLYFLRHKYLFGTPTSVLLRSEIIRSRTPFYDERFAPFEDGHACFELLKTWNFGFVHQVLTYSRRSNDSIISRVRPFGLERFLQFSMIIAHGRNYLSPQEYAACLKNAQLAYLGYLAKNKWKFESKAPEFWEFHRKGLASIGYTLDWRLLVRWMPRAFVEKLWEGFWGRWDRLFSLPTDKHGPFD